MKRVLATVGIGGCGLVLLGAPVILPLAAQEQTSEQVLFERLRQSQLERGAAGAEPAGRAEELIRQIEVVERQLRSEQGEAGLALSEEEVRGLVREGLGMEVLGVEPVERDGRQLYAVTVMNPPGNYNGAFMVRTVLIDGTTGSLVGEVPHTPRTAATEPLPGAPAAGPNGNGLEIRRRTHR
jgi:hypothetical protein